MDTSPIKIIVYEDNPDLRESLSVLLRGSIGFELVGAFVNCENVESQVNLYKPDVVLMDIDMPLGNGINGTRAIKAEFPALPIIMQTVFDDNENIFEAIKAGANGYLLKKTAPDKLLDQLREAFEGGAPMTGTVAIKVLQFFREEPISPSYHLTDREKNILKLLVEGHSYKMIAAKSDISYFTVCNHIKKIYEKLHVNSATEAVRLAIQQKIVS
mgnify:CR=1 FL=1